MFKIIPTMLRAAQVNLAVNPCLNKVLLAAFTPQNVCPTERHGSVWKVLNCTKEKRCCTTAQKSPEINKTSNAFHTASQRS